MFVSYRRMVGFSSSSWYIRVYFFFFTRGVSQALRVHSRLEMYPALILKMEVNWHVQWLMSNDPGPVVAMNLVPLAAMINRSYVLELWRAGCPTLMWSKHEEANFSGPLQLSMVGVLLEPLGWNNKRIFCFSMWPTLKHQYIKHTRQIVIHQLQTTFCHIS